MFEIDRQTVRRLVVGDVAAILAFVTIGEYQHNPSYFAASRLPELASQLAGAAVPFLTGWALAAVVLGAYRRDVLDSPANLAVFTLGPWVAADLVGQLLRGTALFPGDASPVFFAVAALFGGIFLLAWRAVTATLPAS